MAQTSQFDFLCSGVNTACVLGGFFVFVCLLVLYKSKLKPMWKERQVCI